MAQTSVPGHSVVHCYSPMLTIWRCFEDYPWFLHPNATDQQPDALRNMAQLEQISQNQYPPFLISEENCLQFC